MPQMQVRDETAEAIGRAIAESWAPGASLEHDGAAPEHDGGSEPSAAVRIGSETLWLAGELPPGLPEAVATALGGEVSAETPALLPAATRLSYRWAQGRHHGRADIYATPETWAAFGGGEPVEEVAAEAEAEAETQAEAASLQPEPAPSPPEAPAPPAGEADVLASLPPLGDRPAGNPAAGIDMLLDVPLDVTVELGRAQKQVRDVLDLRVGSIIGLDRPAGEPVDVLVNGKPIARGEVVVIDENFGVRITDVLSQAERINRLA